MSERPELETRYGQKPLFVFLHIPKTAGTSLSHLLRNKFATDSIKLIYSPAECARTLNEHAEELDASIDCISGHIDYGIHHYLARDCVYFSMMREPVSRVLSHYHFTRSQDASSHPLRDVIETAQKCTITEYLQEFPAVAFEQITALSGTKSRDSRALNMARGECQLRANQSWPGRKLFPVN